MGSSAESESKESEDMFENKKDYRSPLVPLGKVPKSSYLCGVVCGSAQTLFGLILLLSLDLRVIGLVSK